jgi:ElaB/YqjD/DUF883 family membrane-anchored ribosome-binding protein
MASLLKSLKEAGIDQGHDVYNRAAERARDARSRVREQAETVYSTLGSEVEARPFTSLLTAFGTGFVIGMLLDRNR